MIPTLVSPEWLSDHISDPNVKVVDASWHMPKLKRDAQKEFLEAHIPGAAPLFLKMVCDSASPLPHTIPRAHAFTKAVTQAGITMKDHVIVYDASGVFAAPRVWWQFLHFSYTHVSILNGGLPAWQAKGYPTESGPTTVKPVTTSAFHSEPRPEMVVTLEDVRKYAHDIQAGKTPSGRITAMIDARPEPRFLGTVPEPRPGLLRGHVPGATNLPRGKLMNGSRITTDRASLLRLFESIGTDPSVPGLAISCGSGTTSCMVLLAAVLATGKKPDEFMIYNGSSSEWLLPQLENPIECQDC
eukprot:gnl/Dysnectes_brevis/608_a672_5847.p1 GENE.gnl/Dysnectes_brevis/608_a672_5847~~gnl/Dysnectes_brevis/608_a672_5847.p1  ORF type:complete len:326 (-),score=73.89 gnl/Dysnectes_brevis/608_a672_5847:54-950(-)